MAKWLSDSSRFSDDLLLLPPLSPSFSLHPAAAAAGFFSPLFLLLPFFLSSFSFKFRAKEGSSGGRASVDGRERKSCGEGRSFVCGPRGVLGQLRGAEVSRCVWYATVSCIAPSHVNRHKRPPSSMLVTRGMAW